jgi:hypothetical protein
MALANSLVRLRGWWLHHERSETDSPASLPMGRAGSYCCGFDSTLSSILRQVSRNENSISALSAKHRKNRLESCGMSWIEGWIIGNELLLAWLVISSPFAVLVGLFIKSGSWK